MAPASADSEGQVKFLITCIRFSDNGKPDFGKIAEHLGINKPAASMRYSRLLKAHGINRDGSEATEASGSPTKPKTPRTPKTPKITKGSKVADDNESPAKKRKTMEEVDPFKEEPQVKSEDVEAGDDADNI